MFDLSKPVPTMSSLDLAELTEKRHDNVKRTIETLANQGVISQPQIEDGKKAGNGVVEKLFRVGQRDSYVIVAQLSPEFTARLVDRWQELENAQAPKLPTTMAQALRLAAEQAELLEKQSEQLAIAQPKVQALERLSGADGSTCITDAAKDLRVRPKELFTRLQADRWIYRRAGGKGYVGYQDKIQAGYLEHKVATVDRPDGSQRMIEQVLVTPKGLTKLAQNFGFH